MYTDYHFWLLYGFRIGSVSLRPAQDMDRKRSFSERFWDASAFRKHSNLARKLMQKERHLESEKLGYSVPFTAKNAPIRSSSTPT